MEYLVENKFQSEDEKTKEKNIQQLVEKIIMAHIKDVKER